MKKHFVNLGILIFILLLLVGCNKSNQTFENVSNSGSDFAKEGSSTDIKTITESYSKTDSLKNSKIELKYANLYKNITSDTSDKATRIIGTIAGAPVTAKEFEIEALKRQVNGSKDVYTEALDRMKIYIYDENLAKQYHIEFEKEAHDLTNQNRQGFEKEEDNNEVVQSYFIELYKAFGMTGDEYWNEYAYELNRRLILHGRVEKYLKDNDLPSISVDEIQVEITDIEYLEKIKAEKDNGSDYYEGIL